MRERPFIAAGEQPRPFSEVLAERSHSDPGLRRREAVLEQIADLEASALDAADSAERKRLQCEAEALRCALHEVEFK